MILIMEYAVRIKFDAPCFYCAELAKRDQLIEQASSLWIRELVRSPWNMCKAYAWLKEVEELKEMKS